MLANDAGTARGGEIRTHAISGQREDQARPEAVLGLLGPGLRLQQHRVAIGLVREWQLRNHPTLGMLDEVEAANRA